MTKPNPINKIIAVLKHAGATDKQVGACIDVIMATAYSALVTKTEELVTLEDAESLEKIETQKLREEYMAKIFEEKTGQNAEAFIIEYVDEFGNGIADKYIKEKF